MPTIVDAKPAVVAAQQPKLMDRVRASLRVMHYISVIRSKSCRI